jgi:hypothetical protein
VVAVYEQIKPDDAFGRQMVANLAARGCGLQGISATPTLGDHCRRLERCGWHHARAWDMDTIYRWAGGRVAGVGAGDAWRRLASWRWPHDTGGGAAWL